MRPPRPQLFNNWIESIPEFEETKSAGKMLEDIENYKHLKKSLEGAERLEVVLESKCTIRKADCACLKEELNTALGCAACKAAFETFPGATPSASAS